MAVEDIQTESVTRSGRPLPRWAQIVRASAWTPTVIALFGMLLILASTGAVLLQHQIALRDALASRQAGGASEVRPGAQAVTDDFTLAPEEIRALDPDDARIFNAGIPFSTLPILAARPFIMAPDRIEEYSRALDCMTAAIYYEAASESAEGKAAVAQVVINRMRHPAYPHSICGVVFQGSDRVTGCQFSFTCDGAMNRPPSVAGWAASKAVAAAALNGFVASGVGMATHYHTDWVAPYWAERLVKMKQIGAHIFYRWAGSWGLPQAFNARVSGTEPIIGKMLALGTPLDLPLETIDPAAIDDADIGDVVVALPAITPTQIDAATEPVATEPSPAVTETPAAPPPPRTVANPLTTPTEPRERRPSRLPVPSNW